MASIFEGTASNHGLGKRRQKDSSTNTLPSSKNLDKGSKWGSPLDVRGRRERLSILSRSLPEWTTTGHSMEGPITDSNEDIDGSDFSGNTTIPMPLSPDEQQQQEEASSILRSTPLSALETLGPDLSSAILQHLSVQEISRVAILSKAMYQEARNSGLWKIKFQARWKYPATGTSECQDRLTTRVGDGDDQLQKEEDRMDWFRAYRQAYLNTHDLWITHWNCVDPSDGLGPGRCCIQSCRKDLASNSRKRASRSYEKHICPTCRFHPRLHDDYLNYPSCVSTRAQAMAAATRLRLQQASQHNFHISAYSQKEAARAFSASSTLHRTINTEQYSDMELHFLSDLLFFEVHDSKIELEDMKHLFPATDRQPHDSSETALHSWHLCHFTNPNYTRPLVWRISIMRKDCFTVYPSEGLLQPGESQVVVFGVKPLASLLALATQQLNAHREGVDEFWANVYTEEAHLPPAPFLIHYHYATATPSTENHNNDDNEAPARNAAGPRQQQNNRHLTAATDAAAHHPLHPNNHTLTSNNIETNRFHLENTPWQQSGKPDQPVRIMYLSAHVNVNYSLREFQSSSLVPFSIRDHRTLAYCAPQLAEFHPSIWKLLDNLQMERGESVQARTYRTEPVCEKCGNSWGCRLEELGQAFVLAKLESAFEEQQRDEEFTHIHRILVHFFRYFRANGRWTERHHQICFQIHKRLVDYRGAPWLSREQREVLVQWEAATDWFCLHYTPVDDEEVIKEYFMVPWRHAGVYRNLMCTHSVFTQDSALLRGSHSTLWKEEPKYLEAFAHLAHSPGRFCLGPQEDPNHLRLQPQSRYCHRQRGCVSDMFFDDPVCGLQAALCVVSDPRSLMVHGIWDRVPYPGTLMRRPKLQILPTLDRPRLESTLINLEKLITTDDQLLYYELQNNLDMESIMLVDSLCTAPIFGCSLLVKGDHKFLYSDSLQKYLHNIPPPGSGRYPLSTTVRLDGDGKWEVRELIFRGDEGEGTTDSNANADSNTHGNHERNPNRLHNFNLDALHGQPGPRILNLLWVLSAHLGWTVDDNQGAASVYVDRRILIGAQWLSISLMAAPLFWTLFARYARWIPATPIDYSLQALPFNVENEMRFLNERECGYVSFILLFSWLCLGRWIERYTSRDFFRAMLEHLPSEETSRQGYLQSLRAGIRIWWLRKWDSVCPLFLQRMVFVPKWNRRSQDDLMKHVAFWRSNQDQSQPGSSFRAVSGGGFVFIDNRDGQIHLGEVSWSAKVLIGILVSLASFSASSPHFFLNLLTVFSSSISLGLSMSLQSMETGRAGVTVSATGSIVETLSLVTIVVLGFLVGQLVGSSGGVLFLAEFVVTSISLVLGGAGTISASAMESWGTFFCLAITAFWGFLFGRVSIMEGIRQKKSGFSSVMLCLSLFVLAILWLITIFAWKFETPIDLVVHRPILKSEMTQWATKYHTTQLQ